MASNLTFYFAWVNQADSAWSPAYARHDEVVFNIEIACDEGQIPKLTIEVINPRIGPLAPGRLYWAWLSYSPDGGTTVTPLFFGRIVGIPQTILYNTVKYELIARSPTYIQQKQLAAESLKILPNYDPIFFDVQKRDDPDAILEGWSVLYAVDRTSGAVSASDILIGEDGTLVIEPQDTFYDSVTMKLQQSPLAAVNVKALVTWEQQYTGYFSVGSWTFPTLGNEPFVADWPKTGVSIGGGYSGAICWAGIADPFVQILTSSNINYSYSWRNGARQHTQGDTMSIDYSSSMPTQPMALFTTEWVNIIGIVNPYTVDAGGYPDPTNIPAMQRYAAVGVRTFDVGYKGLSATGVLGLKYEANRKRSELVDVTVQAAVQPILVDPLITEDTETVTLKSGDLAIPMINLVNWSTVQNTNVAQGTFIFPDNPLVAGQTSSQICVIGGLTGTTEPTFSNIAGATTVDNQVTWSSLGSTPPTEISQDWQQFTPIALGTLLLPKPISGAPDLYAYKAPGNLNNPPMGVPTAKYTILAENLGQPGDTMLEVTGAGIVGGLTAAQAVFHSFINPSGQDLYICIQAGKTGEFHTTFHEAVGATTTDGTVVWQNIGKVSLPIGGWPGMTPAASYFPSDRGQQSLQHLLCRARAKLRRRARAVQVTFQCRFEPAVSISCRMNATITDPRLPGGRASGKVVSYKLRRDGDSGQTLAEVTIGCAIGSTGGVLGGGGGAPPPSGGTGYVISWAPNTAYDTNQAISSGSSNYIVTTPHTSGPTFDPGATDANGNLIYQPLPPTTVVGTPVYVDGVFNEGEVEVWLGSTVSVPTAMSAPTGLARSSDAVSDIGYTPPVQQTVDDGVSFPLSGTGDVLLTSLWHGQGTEFAQAAGDYNAQVQAAIVGAIASAKSTPVPNGTVSGGVSNGPELQAAAVSRINASVFQGTYLWYELCLKNLQGGPYAAAYVIDTTTLNVPKTIDLSAPSTG